MPLVYHFGTDGVIQESLATIWQPYMLYSLKENHPSYCLIRKTLQGTNLKKATNIRSWTNEMGGRAQMTL